MYIHPDFQAHLILNSISDSEVPIQPEWVLPMNIAEKWSLARLADVFDSLPKREALVGANGFKHQDAKRMLLAMLSHNGMGGDGTIVYYIMQEGDVKPRQN
jgi:tRNA-splicing endonuclease subunit Sen15, fungi type